MRKIVSFKLMRVVWRSFFEHPLSIAGAPLLMMQRGAGGAPSTDYRVHRSSAVHDALKSL